MLYFLILLFAIYLPFQLALNPSSGIDLASGRLLAVLIFLIWIVRSLKQKKVNIPSDATTFLLISFLFFCSLSTFFSVNSAWSARKLIFFLSFFPLYFVLSDTSWKSFQLRKMVEFIIWGGWISALIGIFQFSLQFLIGLDNTLNLWRKIMPWFLGKNFFQSVNEYSSWLVNIGGHNYFRSIAFFPDPHMFSLFLGILTPWSIIIAFQKTKRQEGIGIIFWFFSGIMLLANFLTFSRGGYLGLTAGLIGAVFFIIIRYRQRYRTWLWIILLLLIMAYFIPNPISQRLLSSLNFQEGSNQKRLANWEDALGVIKQKPILGTGLGNYSLAIKPSADYREPIYAHNLYLDIAAETGILNSLIWIAMILCATWFFAKKSVDDIFYLGGALGLIIFSIHSIFETGIFSVQLLPALIMVLALSNNFRKND